MIGIGQLENAYRDLRAMDARLPIATRLLNYLQVTVRVSDTDLARIPKSRPVLLVANHPFGILEGAVLADLLLRIRPDVKVLANGLLASIAEGRDLIIPVDPMGGAQAVRANRHGVRESIEFLAAGGLLVVFPAGEVSHISWNLRGVSDAPWNSATLRILAAARRTGADVAIVPVHIAGRNSLLFQAAGLVHPRLRSALLARELLNKRGGCVQARIGNPVSAAKLASLATDRDRIEYLRWRTYLLAARNDYKPRTNLPLPRAKRENGPEPIAPPEDSATLAHEVAKLTPLIATPEFSVYAAHSCEIPTVLREIGRLREIAFRAVGEGAGKARDLDAFDAHYVHLFLWNARKQEIAGAYRLAGTDTVRELYTATLFQYGNEFRQLLGPALELGRSFVRVEYQRALAPLLLLWKGIAKYVVQHPRYRILFGAVSISNRYQAVSRHLMVSFLERTAFLKDWATLVSSRNPFRAECPAVSGAEPLDVDDLSDVISDLDPSQPGVPVLLRQYLKLGGKLLGFNVDPKFSNALDGLILVDLTKTEPKLLDRFLGAGEAAKFLNHHRSSHATH